MAKIEPEGERERLARWYGGMEEEELKEIAKRQGSLTDVARRVIRAELLRRGLEVEQEELTELGAGDKEMKLAKIRDFMFVPEALVAKSILDSAGIECFLSDETTIRMDWLWANAMRGVKVWVRQEDAETALALLQQDFSAGYNVEDVEEYIETPCPKCQSKETFFRELNKPVAYTSLFLGVPLPLKRAGWRCHSCGYQWQESGDIH